MPEEFQPQRWRQLHIDRHHLSIGRLEDDFFAITPPVTPTAGHTVHRHLPLPSRRRKRLHVKFQAGPIPFDWYPGPSGDSLDPLLVEFIIHHRIRFSFACHRKRPISRPVAGRITVQITTEPFHPRTSCLPMQMNLPLYELALERPHHQRTSSKGPTRHLGSTQTRLVFHRLKRWAIGRLPDLNVNRGSVPLNRFRSAICPRSRRPTLPRQRGSGRAKGVGAENCRRLERAPILPARSNQVSSVVAAVTFAR